MLPSARVEADLRRRISEGEWAPGEQLPRVAQLAFLLVAGFLVLNKVWSPQYSLWLLPLAVLARPRWRSLLLWQLTEALLWVPRMLWYLGADNRGVGVEWSQHVAEVLYVDRTVEQPGAEHARPRAGRVSDPLPLSGAPSAMRSVLACLIRCPPRRRRDPARIAGSSVRSFDGSDRANVRCLRTLLALREVVLHLLVLVQIAVPLAGDGAEVYEHVGAAVLRSDEAETLLGAEPLHGSCCHCGFPLSFAVGACLLPVSAPA